VSRTGYALIHTTSDVRSVRIIGSIIGLRKHRVVRSLKMEMERAMQQIVELLLVRMNASMKEHMQEIKDDRKVLQATMDAKHKETMPKIDAETGAIQGKTKAIRDKRMKANRESNQEELKGIMEGMNAKTDGKQEEILARVREEFKSGQAEMISTLDEWLMGLKDYRK
jgi:hypothetical protein